MASKPAVGPQLPIQRVPLARSPGGKWRRHVVYRSPRRIHGAVYNEAEKDNFGCNLVVPTHLCLETYNTRTHKHIFSEIQGVSRLVDITARGDFLGLCDQKSSYKHVSDFGLLRSYDRLKLRIEGNDC